MKGAKILIVDDDIDFCTATTKILENKGYEVVIANDSRSARLRLKKEKPDLIILDIMLPGQDGFSLCSEFKESTDFFEIPILVLTSVSTETEGEKYAEKIALHHKADDFAEKPIDYKDLLARVYALITRREITVSEPSEKKKILFIDSDRDFVRSMRLVLEANNYEVQTADTGHGGIRMVKAMTPDLIIIDVMLPDKDGFTVSRELKTNAQTYNIPILIVTTLDKQFRKPDFVHTIAATHKVDELIPKPIKPEVLLKKIQQYV
ncbi:response regulator [candidate division WOR-3 bacterium]|nr:response regulator [candidate division WOR-3 bacterium]MCK4527183.1 response regulator [candidate division WOR-3 bacterium]